MTLGTKLKNLREDLDLRQIDVAQKVNLGQVSISKYESDINEPDLTVLVKLANLYNVNIDYLLGNSDMKTSWKDINRIISIDGKDYSGLEIIDTIIHLPEKDKKYIISLLELLNQYNRKTEKSRDK